MTPSAPFANFFPDTVADSENGLYVEILQTISLCESSRLAIRSSLPEDQTRKKNGA